jgi:hypothetical protein
MFNFRRSRGGRSLKVRSARQPARELITANSRRSIPGTFGAANRGRKLSDAEIRTIEAEMRRQGVLQ